ncbi:MAG: sugar kinase [Gammaproteobacteria bacterium]|nr:sugar kinase [Gammaproteobacteria bacterium]
MHELNKQTSTILAIGECMLELIPDTEDSLKMSFAGDVYNALVYGKRCFPDTNCAFFTGTGNDAISQKMVQRWQREGINTEFVQYSDQHSLGIYSISVDEAGERSFSYWRKDSAATKLMEFLTLEQYSDLLTNVDLVFFSGISLGILSIENRDKLLALVAKMRAQGKVIAFDPNYRPSMYESDQDASEWMTKAYQVSDIALPGLDEHQDIFNHTHVKQVAAFCLEHGVKEVVIKAGDAGTYVYEQENPPVHVPFTPAPKQIDSTAAGDSFAGAYLVSRLNNLSINNALLNANIVAGEVVQHQGGILTQTTFNQTLSNKIIK